MLLLVMTTTTTAAAAAVATTGTATEAEAEATTTEAEATLYAFHDIHAVDDVLVACSVPWNAKHPISMIIIIIYARTPQSSSSYRNTITLTQKRGGGERERAAEKRNAHQTFLHKRRYQIPMSGMRETASAKHKNRRPFSQTSIISHFPCISPFTHMTQPNHMHTITQSHNLSIE